MKRLFISVCVTFACCAAFGGPNDSTLKTVWSNEFALISKQIANGKFNSAAYARLKKETLRQDALILPTDKTPIDVVWRRTDRLLKHLTSLPKCPDLSVEEQLLNTLKDARSSMSSEKDRFVAICRLRRSISFKNPLLDFDKILFLTHYKQRQGRGEIHMVDQYLGFNAKRGGSVYVIENPFSDSPSTRNLLEGRAVNHGRLKGRTLDQGAFISLDLNYDGDEILFAWTEAEYVVPPDARWDDQGWSKREWKRRGARYRQYHWRPNSCYHIFKTSVNGNDVVQLTDGKLNDYDPCFLPNGRIVFISERIGGNQRCGARWAPTATLHAMMPDGSDLIPLSWHDTNEWHPSVTNHGMIVYSRWDYVDRDSDVAHHLWTCFPDGRDPRSQHGNYPDRRELRPWMELSIRAIPNSSRFIAVAAPHHGENYGSLVLIDQRKPDDRSMSQVKRITPEVKFPEAEDAPGVAGKGKKGGSRDGEVFGTPWALDEDFYLCVYGPGQKHYGLYLVDSFGNRVFLYQDPKVPCLDPIPLRPRKRPPIIPIMTTQAKADRGDGTSTTGTVSIMNVYEAEFPLPKGTTIKWLRVVSVFPKPNAFANVPRIGYAAQSLARGVLGVVPVEADGSAHFECPTGTSIYFQALDEKGQAVQSMRSGTYLHPGERMSCIGCHESKFEPPKGAYGVPIALKREPSVLISEAPGSYPLSFPRLVQPVLDTHCVSCHTKEVKAPPLDGGFKLHTATQKRKNPNKGTKKKNLRNPPNGWTNGFNTLRPFAWGKHGGNGAIRLNGGSYSIPGKVGAKASKLLKMLENGHHKVKLPPEDLRRIVIWLDCNSNFYGAYLNTKAQARGELVLPKLGHVTK